MTGVVMRMNILSCLIGTAFIVSGGCSKNTYQKEEVVVVSEPRPATYCYRSLANVDCYEEPVPEDERTLLVPVE
ncbi:hypothetical protein WH96_04265 [Kiloniella spongiae]|uniref:Lipoprotein n=1 Tax=Kiloniella spongiae TaxID=1489064 RepID=A0A0H2MHB9_9PROT|nr:hypothetical protein [Kiloniella spongiae]KLN61576.1 hypothetical protein WH96_04265 [Kiloniella spongiae]